MRQFLSISNRSYALTCCAILIIFLGFTSSAKATTSDLAEAVSQGLVKAEILGLERCAGNSILVKVASNTDEALNLTIAAGTVLLPDNSRYQRMVVQRVSYRLLGANQFERADKMDLAARESRAFLLYAYSLDFDKQNPTKQTAYQFSGVDTQAKAVIDAAAQAGLSGNATQAALWMKLWNVEEDKVGTRLPKITAVELEAAQKLEVMLPESNVVAPAPAPSVPVEQKSKTGEPTGAPVVVEPTKQAPKTEDAASPAKRQESLAKPAGAKSDSSGPASITKTEEKSSGDLTLNRPGERSANKDTNPASTGRVFGYIYQADSGAPLPDAKVIIQRDGQFAKEGKTVGLTDKHGRYRCEAEMGKATSKIAAGRLLMTGLVGILAGGARKVTRQVQVTQYNLKVEAPGYRAFEGIVPCARIDAEEFNVYLEPIALTKADTPEVSTVTKGWRVVDILEVTGSPSIVSPGATSTITVRLKCPPIDKPKDITIECLPVIDKPAPFKKTRLSLASTSGDPLLFSGEVRLSKSLAAGAIDLAIHAVVPYEIGEDTWRGTVLFPAKTTTESTTAQLRMKAANLLRDQQNVEAYSVAKQICAQPQAVAQDFQLLGVLAGRLHETQAAVDAWHRCIELTPEKERIPFLAPYASALIAAGTPAIAIAEVNPAVNKIKEKDRSKRVSLETMAYLGIAYIQQGNLAGAEQIEKQIRSRPGVSSTEEVKSFRHELRLAKAEKATRDTPASASSWADYGRALMDQGRWEEAIVQLKKAVSIDGALPAVQWDLSYAMLQIQGAGVDAGPVFAQALADAEKATTFTEGKKQYKSQDFFTWHRLGILLYRQAWSQRKANDSSDADKTWARCQDALAEALRCGRAGAKVTGEEYSFTWGYTSPKITSFTGFAYPEANADFLLLYALDNLNQNSNDYLSQLTCAQALIDLGQWDIAQEAIGRTLALQPMYADAQYAAAIVAAKSSKSDAAIALLRQVLAANPRHRDANELLAKLYTEQGDITSAAACLAARAKYYGNSR